MRTDRHIDTLIAIIHTPTGDKVTMSQVASMEKTLVYISIY